MSCLLLALPGRHPSPECPRNVPVAVNVSDPDNLLLWSSYVERQFPTNFLSGNSNCNFSDWWKFFNSDLVNKYLRVEQFDWPNNGCLEQLADFTAPGANVICAKPCPLMSNIHRPTPLCIDSVSSYRLSGLLEPISACHLSYQIWKSYLIDLQSTHALRHFESPLRSAKMSFLRRIIDRWECTSSWGQFQVCESQRGVMTDWDWGQTWSNPSLYSHTLGLMSSRAGQMSWWAPIAPHSSWIGW